MNPNECAPRLRYDAIRQCDWATHPILNRLTKATDAWDNEWHFFLSGFPAEQEAILRHIRLATAVTGSGAFVCVDPMDRSYDHLFDEPANVRWYLADPLLDSREWAALVPRGLDLDDGLPLVDREDESDRELAVNLALRSLAEESLSEAAVS
jgi:hypothetical protein